MFLRPESTLPCFATLFEALPSCTYETWPVPIVGQWLKTSSCIISESQPLLDAFWTEELAEMKLCLNHLGEISSHSCRSLNEAYCGGSLLMMLPKPLRGAPVPDTLQRVAESSGKASVVEKYQRYKDICVKKTWEGWSIVPGQNGETATVFAAQTTSKQEPSNAVSGGSVAGAFFGGVIFSAMLIGSLFAIHQKRNQERSKFGPVRTEGIELS